MRFALRLTLTIGIATTLSLSSFCSHSLAADAPDSKDTKSVDKPEPEAKESTTSSQTKPVSDDKATTPPVTAAPQVAPPLKKEGRWQYINERMGRFERRIVEAVSAGRLGADDAKHLRSELDRVAEMEAVFRALPVSTAQWHTTALSYELDQLTDLLEQRMHDRDIVPSDLSFLKEDVLRRIDVAARQKRLTPQEITDLKQEYNRITALEHMLVRLHGRLSYAEKLTLAIDLDHLSAAIRHQMSEMNIKPFDVAAATAAVEKRTEEALQAGNISSDIAAAIKSQLAEVRETAKRENKEDKKSIIALGLWIEGVSNRLDEQVQITKKLQLTLDARSAAIDKQIAQGLVNGRLTPLEALELKEDLELVTGKMAKDKSAGGLDADQTFAYNLSLARLEGLIDRLLHGPGSLWSGAIVYHTHLDSRIKEALAAKRLGEEDAKSLDASSDAIAVKMRSLGGPAKIVQSATALEIAISLQQLSAGIDKAMKDRAMAQPNIEALQGAIDKRLGDAIVLGQLNLDEGKSATDRLAQVSAQKDRYKSSDGTLSGRELWAVAYELQRTASDVEELIHDHPALFPGLEIRRAQIDELLAEGVSSGRLSTKEAESFRALLNQNESMEKDLHTSSPGYSSQQAIELVGSVERSHNRLDSLLREKQVPTSDLLAAESQTERKIARFFSLGYITPLEAESLRRQFGSIVTSLKSMRGAQGGLSYGERLAFLYGFERISAATERHARSTPLPLPNIVARHADLEQKIGNAVATGRLSTQEAIDLKGLLEELRKSATRAHNSGGGMSYPEALIAVVDVERLSNRVDERVRAQTSQLPDIDTRQAQLEKRIQQASASGKLTAEQASLLRKEMDRIAEGEVAFRMSDEALNFGEAISLIQDLERLGKRIDLMVQTPAKAKTSNKPSTANKSNSTPKKKNL